MAVRLVLVPETEKPALRRLLGDHLAEMNLFADVGTEYRYFDLYWTETSSRWPYWIVRQDEIVGFALINTWSPSGSGTDYSVAEFYICQEHRGQGFGRAALAALLRQHPGQWELSVLENNAPALAFWPRALASTGVHDIAEMTMSGEIVYRFATSVPKGR
jgi:predicted acetyltransferase